MGEMGCQLCVKVMVTMEKVKFKFLNIRISNKHPTSDHQLEEVKISR
jgi:hypothetical protein